MDIEAYIQQLPNLAGLLFCVIYLWRDSERKNAMISHLIDVIIKRENCEDDEKQATLH